MRGIFIIHTTTMNTLPPVPSSAPQPAEPQKRKSKSWIVWLIIGIVLSGGALAFCILGIAYPIVTGMMAAGDCQLASENLKQVGVALHDFKVDMKAYPCDATAMHPRIRRAAEQHGEMTGSTSNPYFRQLFYKIKGGVNEENFYAPMPDFMLADSYTGVGETLKPGECAFSYVMRKPAATAATTTKKGGKNKKAAAATEEESFRPVNKGPIAMCGTIPSDTPTALPNVGFDLEVFGGKACAVTTDGRIITLEEEMHLEEIDGTGMFIPGMESDIFRTDIQDYVNLSPETF
jgi:hypothetical protein